MDDNETIWYLKYTQDYDLHYRKYPTVIEGYSDVNRITRSNKIKSTNGYAFTLAEEQSLRNHPNR